MPKLDRLWVALERLATIGLLIAASLVIWKIGIAGESTGNSATGGVAIERPEDAGDFASPVARITGSLDASVVATAAIEGGSEANRVIVEFTDYECPFCATFAKDIYPDVKRELIDTGETKYAVMNFPLAHSHPDAFYGATVAECAREQGRFWDIRGLLYTNQQALGNRSAIMKFVKVAGVDVRKLQSCLDTQVNSKTISAQQAEGRRLGISATPTFIVGQFEKDGSIRAMTRIVGAHSLDVFRTALNSSGSEEHKH